MKTDNIELVETKTTQPTPKELWNLYNKSRNNPEIEEKLVKNYLHLVKGAVGRIAITLPDFISYDDLYSAGLVGLLQAIRNYDPSGGSSFENYAKARIRGAILDELRKMDWVPRSVHSKARKVQEAINQIESKKGGLASEEEIAKALNLTTAEYEQLLAEIRPVTFICLDAVNEAEEVNGGSFHDSIADQSVEPPDVKVQKREFAMLIAQRIEQLPVIQRKVLAMYYFENMRLKEIAEAFGLTESRICQMHTQAILAIRAYLQRNGLIS